MFGKKIENTKNLSTDPSSPTNNSDKQAIAAEIKQHPIHTLKSDSATLEIDRKKSPADFRDGKSNPAANPFLSEAKINLDSTEDFSHSEKSNAPEKKSSLGKLFFSVFLLLVLVIILGGGYYFWVTRVKNTAPASENTVNLSQNTTPATTSSQPAPPAATNLSQKQANFLSMDIQNSDNAALKTTLKDYDNQVIALNAPGPIEFVVTDKFNAPVAFHDFAQKLGLTLPQNILAQLNDTFSFYIYLDNAQPRFGLAVHSKDTTALRTTLSQAEGNLPQELASILPESAVITTPAIFNSSTYNGAAIRYTNITSSPANTSIDYTLTGSALIIGTSKMTTRSILDYLSKQTAQ